LFRKNPLNIINGTSKGALRAKAALAEGAATDKKEP